MQLQREGERLEDELRASSARETEAREAHDRELRSVREAEAATGGEKHVVPGVETDALVAELRAVREREAALSARLEEASQQLVALQETADAFAKERLLLLHEAQAAASLPHAAPSVVSMGDVGAAEARCAALEAELGELQAANNRLSVEKAEAERAMSLRSVQGPHGACLHERREARGCSVCATRLGEVEETAPRDEKGEMRR